LKGNLKNTNYENYPNVITKLQKRYLTENVYRTVQMDKSDDFGLVLFNIIESTQDYILIFQDGSSYLDTTNNLKFLCTSGLCDVTFVVSPVSIGTTPNLQYSTAYNNQTQMYQLNFSDTTGLTSSVQLIISREIGATKTTICDTTISSSSGTINCNTTGYNGLLRAEVYSSASPLKVQVVETISKYFDKLYQQTNSIISSNELTLWGSMISITLIVAGSFVSIIVGIIAYIISLFVLSYMGLINFVTGSMITISIVLSIIVAYFVNKRYNS
jgi:hypothetical protein